MPRLHFCIQLYTKAISPIIIPYLILKHISSRLKPFSTRIFPLATHQESNKDSSRAKLEDSYEKTPQKQHLRKKKIKKISDVKFTETSSALKQINETSKQILPFVTHYQPWVPNRKHEFMGNWHYFLVHYFNLPIILFMSKNLKQKLMTEKFFIARNTSLPTIRGHKIVILRTCT